MIKRLFLLCFSTIFFTIFAFAQKAITHPDLWLMKRVGAPKLSPDGKWAVFSVTEPAYDEKEAVNDLWLVPADGSAKPRRITGNKGGESAYCWSPDGKTIAFTAKRDADDAAQIYLLPLFSGGEAQRITNLSTGASAPQFNADGSQIAFTSMVYPGAFTDSANKKIAAERRNIKYKARVYTNYPVRNWDKWVDDKQRHLFVQKAEAGQVAKNLMEQMPLAKAEGFLFGGSFCWSSNDQLIFAATDQQHLNIHQDVLTQLYAVNANGSNTRQLTNDGDDYGSPEISPDGRYLLCVSSKANNYKVYNGSRLTRFSWPAVQNKTILSESLNRSVGGFQSSKNGRIVFEAEDQGHDRIYAVNAEGGPVQKLSPEGGGCFTGISTSEDGNTIIASFETASQPAEIARLNSSGPATLLSQFNTEKIKELDLPAAETIWFKSSRGKQIRSLLVKPAGFNATQKYPLLVLMHGGPAGSWKDNWGYRWNYHMLASPGYVIILTDYTGSTGYGDQFSQDIQYDPYKGPASEINEAAADAIKRFAFIDGSRQACGGASYGGHLANWMLGTTTHYKCLINHAGLMNSEAQWGTSDGNYGRTVMAGGEPWAQTKTWTDQNPVRLAKNFKTPMLVTVGEQDFRVPLNNSLETWAALNKQKVPGKLIVFPEENHWILNAENSRFFYQELHDWLKKYLNP